MSPIRPDRIPVAFYVSKAGADPVRGWLRELPTEDRKAIGTDLKRVQEQWPIGMPVCKSLGAGLWEVRSTLASNRIARTMFCFHEGVAVVLHAFIKKTQKTSQADLALARERMKDVKR
jgi:phage-related protein